MQLDSFQFTVVKPNPPPLWFVTNGETTVGPVVTDLLKRGVEYGRVPEYCRAGVPNGRWRKLESIREIAALYRTPGAAVSPMVDECFDELRRLTERARDRDEDCYQVTRLAMIATGAESGMLHFRDGRSRSLRTRCVLGPMSDELLNQTLPDNDPVLRAALLGLPVLGPPYGPAEDALAIRFATSEGGVGGAAMVPIYVDDTLVAMLELSRPGHAFRRGDLQRAERIAQRALYRYAD